MVTVARAGQPHCDAGLRLYQRCLRSRGTGDCKGSYWNTENVLRQLDPLRLRMVTATRWGESKSYSRPPDGGLGIDVRSFSPVSNPAMSSTVRY